MPDADDASAVSPTTTGARVPATFIPVCALAHISAQRGGSGAKGNGFWRAMQRR